VSRCSTSRTAVLGLTVGALAAGGLALAQPASAVSPDVVIAEVYGGGGNSGATYTHDFIELRNTGTTAVDLSGWSVQYASAGGSSWQTTPLTGVIAPNASYLVQEAQGTAGTTALPTPNAVGTIAMGGTGGKVALVTSTTALTGTGLGAAGVRDFVGYGAANAFEGSAPAPAPSNTTSTARPGGDTDQNAVDFAAGAPSPTAGAVTPPPDPDPEPEPDPLVCASEPVTIGSVQGSGPASLLDGSVVTVAGVVVGDLQEGGFAGVFVQDAGDGDATTSDGVFVYRPTGDLALGERLVVRGTVDEFNGLTQLTQPQVVECGAGQLPAPAELPLPSTDAEREAFEGMLVTPAEALTVTDVYDLDVYGQVQLAQGGRLVTPTEAAEPGPGAVAVATSNATRSILLDDGRTTNLAPREGARQEPPFLTADDPVRVGDTAQLEPTVLTYTFGAFTLEPADGTAAGTTFAPTNPRPTAPDDVLGDLRIADFNVLNYFIRTPAEVPAGVLAPRGATSEAEFAQQQAKIVAAMTAMDADVFTLHEIENSAIYDAASPYAAVETLVAALEAADGHDWDVVRAHEDTDAITNAIIYRTDRVTTVGAPMTPTSPEATAVFANARTPIAQTFDFQGEVFSVIANHLKSKGSGCSAESNDPTPGGQGNCNGDRVAQTRVLVGFTAEVVAASGDQDVLLTGDFNAYRNEDPLDVLREAGLQEVFTEGEYSYVFDGASGSLDHVFATGSMFGKVTGHTIWDINAVESFAYQYAGYEPFFSPDPYRSSDHNPTLIGITPAETDVPAQATISDPKPYRGDRVTVTGTGFEPGERVTASLPSRNRGQLGSAVADAEGTVTIRFTVPVLLPAGDQEVLLRGTSGETASTSFQLRTLLQELLDRLLGWWHGR
jgi:5'-nucleotidase